MFFCFSVPVFLCSCVHLNFCSFVSTFFRSSVPVFLCSTVPLYFVPLFILARQPVHQFLIAMLIIAICAPVNAKDTKGRKNWFYFAEATTTAIIVWGADSNNPCSAYSVCIHSTIRPSRGRIPAKLGIKYKIIASSPFKFFPDSFQY